MNNSSIQLQKNLHHIKESFDEYRKLKEQYIKNEDDRIQEILQKKERIKKEFEEMRFKGFANKSSMQRIILNTHLAKQNKKMKIILLISIASGMSIYFYNIYHFLNLL